MRNTRRRRESSAPMRSTKSIRISRRRGGSSCRNGSGRIPRTSLTARMTLWPSGWSVTNRRDRIAELSSINRDGSMTGRGEPRTTESPRTNSGAPAIDSIGSGRIVSTTWWVGTAHKCAPMLHRSADSGGGVATPSLFASGRVNGPHGTLLPTVGKVGETFHAVNIRAALRSRYLSAHAADRGVCCGAPGSNGARAGVVHRALRRAARAWLEE